MATSVIHSLQQAWKLLLRQWAIDGRLVGAAREALQLDATPKALQALEERWSMGDFEDLPPVTVLPPDALAGAAGAYAIETGTIYLNQAWLQTADQPAVLAVLSEELGHHLDARLNDSDTPGDEGELFALLLLGESPGGEQRIRLTQEDDWGAVRVAEEQRIAEYAALTPKVTCKTIPPASPGRTRYEFANSYAFAVLRNDGSVVTWGGYSYGGDSSGVDFDGPNNNLTVSQIFSTSWAFAALRSDGSVITWGDSWSGGDSNGVDFDGPNNNLKVARISSNSSAFAASRNDGSVITWGHPFYGGYSNGIDFDGPNNNLAVTRIFSTSQGFAALRSDGTVVTWGDTVPVSDRPSHWSGDSSKIDFDGPNNDLRVTEIYSTEHAFAALRSDGSVVTWSSNLYGGDSSGVDFNGPNNDLSVSKIFSTDDAFAALRSNGSIVTWGNLSHGGNSSQVDFDGPDNNLSASEVFSTSQSFAALRSDGSVVSWGEPSSGGDSSGVDFNGADNNLTVSQIVSNSAAFAALRNDGTVVTWGSPFGGGISSHVDFDGSNDSLKVSFLYSTAFGFSAVRNDGSVVRWGEGVGYDGRDLDGPDNNLSILEIVSNSGASAALRSDGSIVTWGSHFSGGDSYWIDFDGPENNLKAVSFASPFTDDWLVFEEAPIIPIITAALSPATTQENSESTIVYTLTRTGPAADSLSVYYTVSGSATAGADYTIGEGSASPGVVTFESGEATATVSFIPKRDNLVEEDETITLTIEAQPDYAVATESSVTATIIDTTPDPVDKGLLLAMPFSNQLLTLGKPFSLEIKPYTFIAPGETLTYSASLGDGSPLPSWLSFDETTRSLQGTPPVPGNLNIRLTATNNEGDSVSDTVALTIGKKSTDGWLGGYAHAIAVEGAKAYLATSWDGLAIVDLSSPGNPSIVSRLNMEGYSRDVAVAGNYAFLAASEAGLHVVNIEDPEQPALKTSYDTTGSANAVVIAGQYAYIADWDEGLQVISISDPLLPKHSASFATPGTAMNVAVIGDYAYVADSWQGLTIIDLRMPSGSAPAGRYATGSSAYAVTVANGLAFVICRDGMEILSLASNPIAPTFVSRYVFPEPEDTSWIKPPSIANGRVYISTMNSGVHVLEISDPSVPKLLAILATTEANDLAVVDDEIIVADQYTLRVLDRNELDATPGIAEPLVAASLRGQTAYLNQPFSYQLPEQLFVDPGDRLTWAATAGDGSALPSWLHFDATTHTLSGTPSHSGSLNVRITSTDQGGNKASDTLPLTVFAGNAAGLWSNDIIIRNNKAFTPSYSTLSVLDISTPLEPATASSISLNGYYSSEDDYELSGDSIYLVSTYGGLEIFDIKYHLNPQAKPGYRDGDYATAIAVNGSRAYLGGYQADNFLKVLDISQPSGPVLLHTATANGTPNAIAISKQLAIVAYMNWEGIGIYDLTNPDAPQLIKELRTSQSGLPGYVGIVWDIKLSGSLAYLAAANALLILDLHDPANPTFLGACALPSAWNRRLVVADGFAYLSTNAFGQDTNPGIAVVDVRTPSNPILVEFVAADAPSGLAATSEYLYIASSYGSNGMKMMNLVAPQPLNDGPANLFILGTAAVDATLRVALDDSDPDGDGPFSYAWQSSTDGSSWQTLDIGDNYTITTAEQGQQLRLLITYTDGQGFAETLTLSAGTVPGLQMPRISMSVAPSEVLENSNSSLVYTLNRTGPATDFLDVYYTISGSATPGADYTSDDGSASTGVVTFAPGQSTAAVVFTPKPDNKLEAEETIALMLELRPEYTIGTDGPVSATILDTTPRPEEAKPLLAVPLSSQLLTLGESFALEIKPYTFILPGEALTYSASLGDGSPLPSWLNFDATNRTLYGRPPLAGNLNVRLTATDSKGNSASDTVALTISKRVANGWLGGYAQAIAVEGSKAYLATGSQGLAIVDLLSPGKPAIVARLDTEGYSIDVAVAGNYAFLAASEAGLLVVNIEDPKQAVQKTRYDTPGNARAVVISGQHAYLADGDRGLQIINIGAPLLPKTTATFDTPGYAVNVAVSGDYAYVADSWQGLTIIDLRMPSGSAPAGGYTTSSEAYAVTVSDGLAFVICRDGMEILSLASNPVAPTFVSRYTFSETEETYWTKPPTITNGKAYISTMKSGVHVLDISNPVATQLLAILGPMQANDLAVVGDEIIVGDQDTLRVLDRIQLDATPGNTAPLVAASLRGQMAYLNQPFSYQLPEQLFVDPSDSLTWAASAGDGSTLPSWLHFDAITHTLSGTPSKPGSLSVRITATDQAGNHAIDTLPISILAGHLPDTWGNDIIIRNNKAFMPSYSSLSVLDISTSLEPATVSSISLNGYYSSGDNYELSGDTIYLVSTYGGLEIIDIKDHQNPQARPGYRDSDYSTAIAVHGTRAYLGGYQANSFLKVLDISQPSGPVLLHTATANGTPNAIAISQQLAIVAYMNWEGIGIYDLTDPDAPQLVKELRTYESGLPGYVGGVRDIKISGSLAYLAATNALLVLDLHDPANPTFLGACELPRAWNRRLEVADGFVYLSTYDYWNENSRGIAVVDVRTPSSPTLVDFVAADYANGLAATSEYLYVSADGSNGMQMMNLVAPQALNDGPANLFILGTAAVDAALRAALDDSDPDGDGPFSYAWQSSTDGSSWQTLGIGDNYTITPAEEGQQLRLLITYTDGQGFAETLTLTAGTVPLPQKKETGLSKVTVTESPVGGSYSASASLQQEADDRPLLAIGIDESSLDLGGSQEAANNTVSIAAMVTTVDATATAIGLNASSLQLRPGDDTLTIEAAITGPGSGSDASVGVRDSLVSGNRGDDTITLRGEYWGDRALVFGGAGNDTITAYGIGRDSFIQAGDGDDLVSLGRLETTPGAPPLQRAKGDSIQPSTYRGGAGFDVLHLRETSQAEFEAQATPFSTANESGWLFQGARFSGFEQFLFG